MPSCCTGARFLQTNAQVSTATQPLVNTFDPPEHIRQEDSRYHRSMERIYGDGGSFQGAHWVRIQMCDGSICLSENCNVLVWMDEIFTEDATALHPLRLWKRITLDWKTAVVEDGSFEMRRPFFSSTFFLLRRTGFTVDDRVWNLSWTFSALQEPCLFLDEPPVASMYRSSFSSP